MSHQCRPLPPAGELWERYSYNPLTGEIYSLSKPGWGAIGTKSHKGYLSHTHFSKGKGTQTVRLHRLIWKWVTGHDPRHTVDHINRDVQDNRFWNLRDIDNLKQQRNKGNLKLTPTKVQEIKTRLAAGEFQRVIAADYGISRETVKDIKLGTIWKDVA